MKPVFIRATLLNNDNPVWVNANKITELYWVDSVHTNESYTVLTMQTSDHQYRVKETPEEIISLIKEA